MTDEKASEERALADRLVSYADAIVALSVIGASGLGLAIADPDARESIARGANYIIAVNVITGFVVSSLIVVLRKWEADLRADLEPAPKARKYSRYLHRARLVVVWLAVVQAIALMIAIK